MDQFLLQPAVWGLAGGALFGALEVVTAHSGRSDDPAIRRRAWIRLGLGCAAGPLLAEALVPTLATLVPAIDRKTFSFLVGWLAARDPQGLLDGLWGAALGKGKEK